jgi:hypothetical protein
LSFGSFSEMLCSSVCSFYQFIWVEYSYIRHPKPPFQSLKN